MCGRVHGWRLQLRRRAVSTTVRLGMDAGGAHSAIACDVEDGASSRSSRMRGGEGWRVDIVGGMAARPRPLGCPASRVKRCFVGCIVCRAVCFSMQCKTLHGASTAARAARVRPLWHRPCVVHHLSGAVVSTVHSPPRRPPWPQSLPSGLVCCTGDRCSTETATSPCFLLVDTVLPGYCRPSLDDGLSACTHACQPMRALRSKHGWFIFSKLPQMAVPHTEDLLIKTGPFGTIGVRT